MSKVWLVTGSASGLGRNIAEAVLASGDHLVATARDPDRLEDLKDWGKGQPLVFSHGWPLSADAFEDQMLFLAERDYRRIAHDRRGHSGCPACSYF
jgi:NAD(P)-dependent dehydrogenase (short-subunit alcohol dehydrogenase family)